MGTNRVFFPQQAVDRWLSDGRAELRERELRLTESGRRYRLIEAVRIVKEVTGLEDAHEIVGRVKSENFMRELGAELLGTSMVVGENAYEVVPGFIGSPIGTFAEHRARCNASAPAMQSSPVDAPQNEEEILARLLVLEDRRPTG
jgi:hypothetical protein